MFQIEKAIPLPAVEAGQGRPPKYPFAQLEVGDSFFVPAEVKEGDTQEQAVARLRGRMDSNKRQGQKLTGFTLAVRTVEGGVRIWRTA